MFRSHGPRDTDEAAHLGRPPVQLVDPVAPDAAARPSLSVDLGLRPGVTRPAWVGAGCSSWPGRSATSRPWPSTGSGSTTADRVVGTSAGSMVASALVGGKLKRLHAEVSLLSKVPALVSAWPRPRTLNPSQQRALDLFLKATDGEPATVQEIGHAALAASHPKPEVMRRNISLVLGPVRWTSEALQITCVDAYTGERCVVTRRAGTHDRPAPWPPAARCPGSSPPSPSATVAAWTAG